MLCETAVDSGIADFILSPEEMHKEIVAYSKNLDLLSEEDEESKVIFLLSRIVDVAEEAEMIIGS